MIEMEFYQGHFFLIGSQRILNFPWSCFSSMFSIFEYFLFKLLWHHALFPMFKEISDVLLLSVHDLFLLKSSNMLSMIFIQQNLRPHTSCGVLNILWILKSHVYSIFNILLYLMDTTDFFVFMLMTILCFQWLRARVWKSPQIFCFTYFSHHTIVCCLGLMKYICKKNFLKMILFFIMR